MEMSATNRRARHIAVCDHKPGGADAYYLKESCAPKVGKNMAVRSVGLRVVDKDLGDYQSYCGQQALKLQRSLKRAGNKQYKKTLSVEAINGVVLIMLSYAYEESGQLPFSKRLTKAMRHYNAIMDRHGTPELKAHACLHLSFEVMKLLHFHFTGVNFMLSSKVRQKL